MTSPTIYGARPTYGTHDFRHFLNRRIGEGLLVITNVVLNHSSDQNAWFQRSRRGTADNRLLLSLQR
jgi:maltose alpha-D-glucosyltransferase / alpha-amylase